MRVRTWVLAAAASAVLSLGSFTFAGDISGTAKLDGPAPEQKPIDMSGVQQCNDMHPDPVIEENVVANDKGMLANVVVSVKKEDSPDLTGDVPKEPAMIDQTGCMYKPHVLAMMGGQDFVVKNSRQFPAQHSHAVGKESELQQGPAGQERRRKDGRSAQGPGVFPRQMRRASVDERVCGGFDHPFFGTSGADGKWTIKNLPDGDYTLVAWQEKLGTQEQKVTIKDGKPAADIVFTFKPEAAMAPDVQNVILASDSGDKTKAATPACC